MNYITKAQDQELKLFNNNTAEKAGPPRDSGFPPAPLLVCRTDNTMVFRPAPFNPPQKVEFFFSVCLAIAIVENCVILYTVISL